MTLGRKDLPSAGVGETGIVALTHAATGTRVLSLPMAPRTVQPGQLTTPYRS